MAKNIKNYSNYELFDFLLDADFKRWVLHPDREINAHWQQVVETFPQQRETIEKAFKIVKNLPQVEAKETNERAKQLWDRIDEQLEAEPQIIEFTPTVKRIRLFSLAKYAAIFAVVIGLVFTILNVRNAQKITITTGNAENREVKLPDGSLIQLAPNSTLSYSKNINTQNKREVWVRGDLHFNVKHINQNPTNIKTGERFVVHLNDSIDVQVLGTVFNVSERRGTSIVYLESGSVQVKHNQQQILLKPGESVVGKSKQLSKKQSPPKITREWSTNILNLSKTKIADILPVLEDNYGLRMHCENQQLLERQIDGAIPLDDLDKTLQILASITGAKINKTSDTISIEK